MRDISPGPLAVATLAVLAALFSVAAPSPGDPAPAGGPERPEKVVRVRATPRTDHQVEMLERFTRYRVSEIGAPRRGRPDDYLLPMGEVEILRAGGIDHEVLPPESGNWNDEDYYSYQEIHDLLEATQAAHPEIARMESLGVSTRDSVTIWGIKISDHPGIQEDEPDVLIDAVIHAREPVNANIAAALIDTLVAGYALNPAITNLIDETEIWIVPIKNPEGYLYVETGISAPWWRKNKRDNNRNGVFDAVLPDFCGESNEFPSHVDGVDLNRNYARWWELAGSPDSCSIVYHGPAPFSENETGTEKRLVERERPVASICFHSYSEYVGYPGADSAGVEICGEMAAAIGREDGAGSYDCVRFDGFGQSYTWMFWEYGVQAYLIETATEFFPSGRDRIAGIVRNNLKGIFTLMRRVHGPGIRGHVTDRETGEPLEAEIVLVGVVPEVPLDRPRTSEPVHGRFVRLVPPGIYSIIARREGYEEFIVPEVVVGEDSPARVEVAMTPIPTGAGGDDPAGPPPVPLVSSLSQNRPNPFNPSTTIRYGLAEDGEVRLEIFDVRGRRVRTLVEATVSAGTHDVHWDGRDDAGTPVPSGVYLYRIDAGEFRGARKMLIAR
jgi:hypothetical protein